MDTLVYAQPIAVSPQKRRLSQSNLVAQRFDTLPMSPHSMNSPSTNNTVLIDRQASPAPSDTSSLTSVTTGTTPPAGINLDGAADSERPAKRRKLTLVEKEQKRVEKEARDKLKEEAKAKREEEKQVKDEERRLKNEVKEEKKREKELKQQEKEEEKRKKQEELDKKERQQSRLGNFFFKKPDSPTPQAVATPKKTQADLDPKRDYNKTFLPFSIPRHTTCAPISRFSWDHGARRHFESTIERSLQPDAMDFDTTLKTSLNLAPFEQLRGLTRPSVRDIVSRIADSDAGASQDAPAQTAVQTGRQAMTELRNVPLKCIYFSVDVRPPYIGTYTKIAGAEGSRLARNPFDRKRNDTNYDEDSEAEWEEPEDGEEIGSDAESDAESTAETDDMDGFLDDEEAEGSAKRRFLVGDMEPVSSGLCWEDSVGRKETLHSMREFKLSLLLDSLSLPIDPFSKDYWLEEAPVVKQEATEDGSLIRPPLQSVLAPNGLAAPAKVPPSVRPSPATPKTPKTPGKILSGEELDRFKQEVAGQTVNKMALLGLLKKSFPKVTNNVLKDTLNTVAARIGRTEAEKKWVIAAPDEAST